MGALETVLTKFNSILWGNWLVFVLLALGVLYTFTNGFIQIRYFGFIIKKTLIDSFKARNEDKGSGSISTFKAMMSRWRAMSAAAMWSALRQPLWLEAWARCSGCGSPHFSAWP